MSTSCTGRNSLDKSRVEKRNIFWEMKKLSRSFWQKATFRTKLFWSMCSFSLFRSTKEVIFTHSFTHYTKSAHGKQEARSYIAQGVKGVKKKFIGQPATMCYQNYAFELNLFQPIRTYLNQSESICACLNISKHIKSYLDLFETI